MTGIQYSTKEVAHHIAFEFGDISAEKATVHRHFDEEMTSHIDILECPSDSFDGYTSLSTIDLSQYETVSYSHKKKPVRVELSAMCKEEQCSLFTKLLVTCSAGVIDQRHAIGPGIVWDDVVPAGSLDSSMKHALFLSPIVWGLNDYEFDDCLVQFLSVIPVSDEEKAFILQNDMDAFLNLLAEKEVDFGDMFRPSVC